MSIAAHLLPHTATISRRTDQPVGGGGFAVSYVEVETGVPCRLQQGRPSEVVRGDIEGADVIGHVYFEASQELQRDDRLAIDGLEMDVIGIHRPSVRAAYCKAIVREVQSGVTA